MYKEIPIYNLKLKLSGKQVDKDLQIASCCGPQSGC